MAFVPVSYSSGLPVLASDGTQRVACSHLAEWLQAYDALQVARGRGHVTYYQTMGGADASAGTHLCGSAWDMRYVSDAAVMDAREMGAAVWPRLVKYGWTTGEHVHGLIPCGDNACNRYQWDAYLRGYNGLGLNGVGAGDPLSRPSTIRSWQDGITWAQAQINGTQEDDMAYKSLAVVATPGGPPQEDLVFWDGLAGPSSGPEWYAVKRVATATDKDTILAAERDLALAWRTRVSTVATIADHDDPAAIAAALLAALPGPLAHAVVEALGAAISKGA